MDLQHAKTKITQIVNVFETGSINGDYKDISIFNDGPNRIRQITYGRSGITEWGNMKALIKTYINKKGQYADDFVPYLDKIGKESLVRDTKFIHLLQKAGDDPIMVDAQNEIFEKKYWEPAVKFFTDNGFTHPLSLLVIYDSYIHSGSILAFLRKRFSEVPPNKGGNEKEWIKQYVDTRHQWLKWHSNPILRNTIYRTNVFKKLIADNEWELDKPINAHGTIVR